MQFKGSKLFKGQQWLYPPLPSPQPKHIKYNFNKMIEIVIDHRRGNQSAEKEVTNDTVSDCPDSHTR